MANKLYEERYIQDIAEAIREKNGSANTYTVAQMGDGIRSIPEFGGYSIRVYSGTITETILGAGVYASLLTDTELAEHKDDERLWVRVEFQVDIIPYTIVSVWAFNSLDTFPVNSLTTYQHTRRWDANGEKSIGNISVPANTTSPQNVGCAQISSDGELRIYSNSASNYAIRPCTFTVTVGW